MDAAAGRMNGIFIAIDVDDAVAQDLELARKLEEVCPVDIFAANGPPERPLRILDENLDECVLCELCIDAAPAGGVIIKKLYDGGELKRG